MTSRSESQMSASLRLKGWARAARHDVRLAELAILMDTLAAIAFALGFATAISALVDGRNALPALLVAAAALIGRGGFSWLRSQASERAGQGLVAAARQDMAGLAAKTGPALFDGAPAGERTAQLVDRTAILAGHAAHWLPGRTAAVLTPVLVVIAIFTQSWLAGALILASTVMLPVFIWLTASETAALARAQQGALDTLAGTFESRVRMAGTIRAFNGVAREAGVIEAAADELARRTMAILRVAFLSTAVLEFFASISIALVAVYVGFKLLGVFPFETFETLTLREGLAALVLAPEFFAPVRQLSALHHARSDARAGAESLAQLAGTGDKAPIVRLEALGQAPRIAWQSADLARSGQTVVRDFNAVAEPGRITLLWGPSGCGKTSVLMSLLALAEPVRGEIRVDGDVLPAGHSLAISIAWIGQKPWALEGTIRDNLRLAAPDADDTACLAALDTAGYDFIADRPDGLDMRIGPGGSGLSGGELQRLALARALLAGAPVLLFDEPTAHLDAERQDALLATLRQLASGRTVIMASHDPAARDIADAVIVMERQS